MPWGPDRWPFCRANSVNQKSRAGLEVSLTDSPILSCDCGWLVIECLLEKQPCFITAGLKSHFAECCQVTVASPFLSRPTAWWENVMKLWSRVALKKKRRKERHTVTYCPGQFDNVESTKAIEHDDTWFPVSNGLYCMCDYSIQRGNKQPFSYTKGFV